MPQLLQVANWQNFSCFDSFVSSGQVGASGSGEFEAKVEGELGEMRSAMKKSEETTSAEFERLNVDLAALNDSWQKLEERLVKVDDKVAAQELQQVFSPPPVEVVEPTAPPPPVEVELPVSVIDEQGTTSKVEDGDLMGRLEQRLASEVAGLNSLFAAPLSVAFDAVRSEDFVGQDGFLPFTKLNANLGDGMNMETGIFTVPVAGLYLFLLNVYGAPRDGVVLSIR